MERTELLNIFHSFAEPRRHSFRNHRHSAFEIGYIADGNGQYQVGDRVFDIQSGDFYFYHANEAHCITDISADRPMHVINIQFEARYIWEIVDGNAYLQTIFQRSQRGANRLRPESPVYAPIHAKFLEAVREWSEDKPGASDMVRMCILSILILLSREESGHPEVRSHKSDRTKLSLISSSMDYICEHLRESLSLSELAERANLSRTYYCTVFKELNGVTPWDYINIKRIELALRLLREGHETVTDIALSCGFNNTANFNKIFRKVTGLTPREYRRTHK